MVPTYVEFVMTSQLFGFFPIFRLPEALVYSYPDFVTLHMVLSFFGAIIFLFSVCYLVVLLFLYLIRPQKQNRRKAAKEVFLSFLWAFGFGFFGLYIFPISLVFVGAMGYRQYS